MSRECVRDERARQREELLVSYLFPTQRREREREKRREKKVNFLSELPAACFHGIASKASRVAPFRCGCID